MPPNLIVWVPTTLLKLSSPSKVFSIIPPTPPPLPTPKALKPSEGTVAHVGCTGQGPSAPGPTGNPSEDRKLKPCGSPAFGWLKMLRRVPARRASFTALEPKDFVKPILTTSD